MNKIFCFLFKCLDKFSREASVLFSRVDIGKAEIGYLNQLLTKYSEIFDFNFLNSAFRKSLYENQNLLIQKIEQNRKNEENKYEEIKFIKNELDEVKKQMSQMKMK